MVVHLGRPFHFLAKSQSSNKLRVTYSFIPNHFVKLRREYTSEMIVPAGIGVAIGGYTGNTLPVARTLSSVGVDVWL